MAAPAHRRSPVVAILVCRIDTHATAVLPLVPLLATRVVLADAAAAAASRALVIESARVLFVLTSEVEQRLPRRDAPLPTAFAQHERFTVYIYYEDIGGHQWTTEVHAEVRADEGLRWFVREVLVGSRGAPQHEMVGSAEWIWT